MEEQDGSALSSEGRANEILIFPNPNNGAFTVRVQQSGGYEVLNSLGQLQQTIAVSQGSAFEVSGLAAGVYFVREVSNRANLQRVIVVE